MINRKLAKSLPSSTQIVKLSDNEYSLNTIIPFKTHQQRFILGQETENTTIDGRKVRNLFTFDGNKLVEKQFEDNREVTIIRMFQNTEMIGKSIVGNVETDSVSTLIE